MTRRIRLLMLVLAVVIVALGTGLIKLNLDTTQDTGDSKTTQTAGREEYYIFQDDDTGLYGVRNENDRVLVDAEWNSLSFAGEQTLLVSRRTGGALRYGMIQINENVRIPFAYSSITPLTGQILAAVTAEDEKPSFITPKDSSCFLRHGTAAWLRMEFCVSCPARHSIPQKSAAAPFA